MKRYILPKKNCLKKQIGLPDRYLWYKFRPTRTPYFPQMRGLTAFPRLALQITAKTLQLAAWLLLTVYRNLPWPYPAVQSPTSYGHLFSPPQKKKMHVAVRQLGFLSDMYYFCLCVTSLLCVNKWLFLPSTRTDGVL